MQLRRTLVIGATTLWYVTVIGLCFGGDQILLGWLATAIGWIVLWAMKPIENLMVTEHDARLVLTIDGSGPAEDEIRARLRTGAIDVTLLSVVVGKSLREYTFRVREHGRPSRNVVPPVVEELANRPGVSALRWSRVD